MFFLAILYGRNLMGCLINRIFYVGGRGLTDCAKEIMLLCLKDSLVSILSDYRAMIIEG